MSETKRQSKPATRMPVVFVGHGSPMNAIEDNRWSQGFQQLTSSFPQPRAILVISAHWYTRGTYLTGDADPRTIHDFSGFPRALYEVTYPAKGHVTLAKRVVDLLDHKRVSLSTEWGFDHGTWSILKWMYPEADIPVVQLSISRPLREPAHFEFGRSLKELRDDGVLIVGSGNVVHNLSDAISRMYSRDLETPPWAREFDETVAKAVEQHDTKTLLSLASRSDAGRMAHPSPDHWLPLLYALGASDDSDTVRFTSEGFDWGSISMRNIVWG